MFALNGAAFLFGGRQISHMHVRMNRSQIHGFIEISNEWSDQKKTGV